MPAQRRMTAAEIRRKTNKPIMEKRRRERINRCLDELKDIVMSPAVSDPKSSKLEKADILEMTVNYLKAMKSFESKAENTKKSAAEVSAQQHQSGYKRCVRDVKVFLQQNEGSVPFQFQTQLLNRLAQGSSSMNPADQAPNTGNNSCWYNRPGQHHDVINTGNTHMYGHQQQHHQSPHLSPITRTTTTGHQLNNASPIPSHNQLSPIHYLSSPDSGNWSAGSNPPSPIPYPSSYNITEDVLFRQTASFASVWRPW